MVVCVRIKFGEVCFRVTGDENEMEEEMTDWEGKEEGRWRNWRYTRRGGGGRKLWIKVRDREINRQTSR